MKKKIKLFSTIAMLCLSLAILAMGVFSAVTVTYKTKGTITYEINDAFVDIETRIFSTSKKFNEEDLATKSQGFEQSNFEILNAMTNLDTDYTWNKVQLKTEGEGDLYVDTYSSVTSPDTAPEELDVDLKYQTKQDDEEAVYTYFVVTKLTNKSSIPLYITVPIEGNDGDKYEAPDNSYTYKLEGVKTLENLGDIMYVVFSMTLEDVTVPISDKGAFTYPISISIEEPVTEGVKLNVIGFGNLTVPVVEGQTLQQTLSNPITINEQEISEYTTCGWFSDEALLEVADLSQPAQKDSVLYTKLASEYFPSETEYVYAAKDSKDESVRYVYCELDKSYKSVVLPASCINVGAGYNPEMLESLETINFHSNIRKIAEQSFHAYDNLKVTLPSNLEYFGEYALGSHDFGFVIDENYIVKQDGFIYAKARDNKTLYMIDREITGEVKDFTIPDGVTIIGPNIFYPSWNEDDFIIKGKLTIPASVKTICDGAFFYQEAITELVLNEGLEIISKSAFGYASITSLDLPKSVKYLGKDAFVGCTKLTQININSTLDTISLDNLALTDYKNYLDAFAYAGSQANECVLTIGDDDDEDKITIHEMIFFDICATTVVIKDNVIKLDSGSFCAVQPYTTTMILSNKVEEIGDYIITLDNQGNSSLKIYYTGTQAEYEALIANLDENDSLHKATVYYYSEEEPTGEGNYWYYNNDVPTAW